MKLPRIELSEDAQEKLVARLKRMIEEAKEARADWEDLHNRYLRQYLCIPDYDEKQYPWPGASNLFLPLGRVIQDGIMAQLHDAMFSNDPFIRVKSLSGKDLQASEVLSLYYGEYVYKRLIPLRIIGNDWNFNVCLDGSGVVRPRWNRDRQLRRVLRPVLSPILGDIPDGDIAGIPIEPPILGFSEDVEEEVTIERNDRPVVDIIDLTSIYPAPDAINSLQYPDCRWYFVERHLTWDELVVRRREGYSNIDDELKATATHRSPTERERTVRAADQTSEGSTLETIPVYEFFMRLTLPAVYKDLNGKRRTQDFDDEDGYAEEVVITYFPTTGKIGRIVPLWRIRPDGKRPDIINHFCRLPNRLVMMGVQAKMYMLNRWLNSAANQMVDYGTLSCIPFFFYSPNLTGILPDMYSIRPGQGVPVNDPRGVQFPRFLQDQSFWLNTLYVGQQWAERDGNITDQTLGRLPERSANRTFRGLALVQQLSNVMFGRMASLMMDAYVELFRAVHQLHLRYATDDIQFGLTSRDGYSFRRYTLRRTDLRDDIDFDFVLNPNRRAEQEIAQSLFQLIMSIPYVAQNPYAVRAAAKQLYNAIGSPSGIRNFDEIWPEDMTPMITGRQPAQPPQQPPIPPIERKSEDEEKIGVVI